MLLTPKKTIYMSPQLNLTINEVLSKQNQLDDRKNILQPLIDYIQQKIIEKESVSINFICTHNSRRSHFSQIWAQVAASYYQIPNIYCYSGGTEQTVLFPKVAETLSKQGFIVFKITENDNPIYAIKQGQNTMPVISFSKKYNHPFNPTSNFAAVMTCSQADGECPFVSGAEKRIPITFEDPKTFDQTQQQDEMYLQTSLQIASEMFYIFSMIKK